MIRRILFSPVARIGMALVLLLLLFWWANPIGAIGLLIDAAPGMILVLVIGFGAIIACNTLAVAWTIRHVSRVPFRVVFRTYLYSWSAEFYFPGKLGMFSLAYFLKKENVEVGASIATILLMKLTMLMLLMVLGTIELMKIVSMADLLVYAGIAAVGFGGLIGLFFTKTGRDFLKRTVLRQHAVHFSGFSRALQNMIDQPHRIIGLILLMLGSISVNAWMVQTLFGMAGYPFSFFTILTIVSSVILVGLIPLSINGLGIKEGALVLLMQLHGVPPDISAGIGLLSTAVGYLLSFGVAILILKQIPSEKWGVLPSARDHA